MRFVIMLIILAGYFRAQAQSDWRQLTGKISYKNTQNIYVRFESTKGINLGDTLYVYRSDTILPGLLVRHLSSISCVTTPINEYNFEISEVVVHRSRKIADVGIPVASKENIQPNTENEVPDNEMDRERLKDDNSLLRGRISIGSYTNFSNATSETTQRMRYNFTLDATHINHSRFSVESYAIFRHTAHRWNEVKDHLASALKIYNLAIRYEPDDRTEISVGRKINRNISNVGAIDGIQVTHRFKDITIGGILGTRPDTYDYSLNLKLLEYGGYIGHQKKLDSGGTMQTTLAVLEQKNRSFVDRRFIYLQHSNSILRNLNLFSSVELDLYGIENNSTTRNISPTSFFLSLNYRFSRKLSISTSYDARKNVIYYESYKNFIDQLIDQETRQGARLRFTYRPFKYVSIGSSVGYRFQKDQQNTSKNLYSYLNISRIPWIKSSATLSSTLLESNYLKGTIFGIVFTKDIINGKLFSEINYRQVKYRYGQFSSVLNQRIGTLNLSGKITKNLSVSVNYEATFEKGRRLNRIYSNIIQRF